MSQKLGSRLFDKDFSSENQADLKNSILFGLFEISNSILYLPPQLVENTECEAPRRPPTSHFDR